jgi:hypothetical protein
MRMNIVVKIIIGLLTAWVVIYPFLFIFAWFFFVFTAGNEEFVNSQVDPAMLGLFLLGFFIMIFSAFLQLIIKGFYIAHIILNKDGTDILRVLSGLGVFFLSWIAMPVYYFVYILPKAPPGWAVVQDKTSTLIP